MACSPQDEARTKSWSNFSGSRVGEPRRQPSDRDAVVTRCAAGAKGMIGQRAGNDRIRRVTVPVESIHTTVLVLAIEGFEPRHLELMAFERRDIADKKVPALTTRHLKMALLHRSG